MLLLEKNITKKGWMNENTIKLDSSNNDNGEYKLEAIWDIAIYVKELESSYLPCFYYLVS